MQFVIVTLSWADVPAVGICRQMMDLSYTNFCHIFTSNNGPISYSL